jgi:phytoene dehydrogenase-like protein
MTAPDKTYDAVIVGGGHNGLVCAAYLARAGMKVLIAEAAPAPGGAAITREILPGFKVSACAHLLHMLHPKVARELKLEGNGLALSARDMTSVALAEGGAHIRLAGGTAEGTVSRDDAEALGAYQRRLYRFAKTLRPLLARVPPRLGSRDWSDRIGLMKLGWAVRRLGREEMREFLRVAAMNVADLLEESFESELLKGALALDAVLGTHLGPRSPNSVLTLIYRMTGECAGVQGALGHPVGGMGAVTTALARAAEGAGAELRCGVPVGRILVEEDRARGIELETGERIAAGIVVSNADPRRTFLDLLGPAHLDTGFTRRVGNIRMRGNAAKLHLALDKLPSFTGLAESEHGGRLVISPAVDYLERAFNHAKYGEYSDAPALEIILPSLHDSSLAPEGKHVLSAVVQYAPYSLKGGWDGAREAFADKLVDLLEHYAPGLKASILARELLTPADLEREFRMTGGHWHHGELSIDQMLMLRPVPGAAQYATPLSGLYLCGAGAHPGGGVMGAAGMNAARQVIARERAA